MQRRLELGAATVNAKRSSKAVTRPSTSGSAKRSAANEPRESPTGAPDSPTRTPEPSLTTSLTPAAVPSAEWLEQLKSRFGLEQFRAGQLAVIERLMSGQSAAAIFPTGGGKSLCYQFPAALLDGLTIVVSPLLALMREQVGQLNELGIPAVRIDSSLTAVELNDAQRRLRTGQAKLLYVAPERFFNERFRELIQGLKVDLFAVDEAHCISQWGHNFRPDYLKLARIAQRLQVGRILALTATATPTVLADICEQFGVSPENAIQTPFFRENLALEVQLCDSANREQRLTQLLKSNDNYAAPAIVYVTLQRTAEEVAQRLQSQGVDARAYHAGLEESQRGEIQDWFMNSDSAVVVATIAFGMGIDKSNIRAVIHYNPSKSLESYAQEIGRAGRDGLPSRCVTLLVPEDRVVLENFAFADTPSRQGITDFMRIIAGQPTEFFLSHYALGYDTDLRDSVVRTLLTKLELTGFLESTAPRYEVYKFKPKVPSAQILAKLDEDRRQFASSVLAMVVKKRVYCEVNVTHAATRLQSDRSRIVRMLEYFDQQQWIELEVSGLVHGYRKLQPVTNLEAMVEQLCEYVQQREQGEIARIDQLIGLFAGSQCLSQALSLHFGQQLSTLCGKCSVCQGNALGSLPQPEYSRVGDSARTAVARLQKQHPELLADRRAQARFLCGMSSPKLIRSRLTRDSAFGCCAEIPFRQVLDSL